MTRLLFGGVRDSTVKRWWRTIGSAGRIGAGKDTDAIDGHDAPIVIIDEAKQYDERTPSVSNAAGFTSTELREIINDLTHNEGDLKKRDIALVKRVKGALDGGTAISDDMADQLHEVWMRLC